MLRSATVKWSSGDLLQRPNGSLDARESKRSFVSVPVIFYRSEHWAIIPSKILCPSARWSPLAHRWLVAYRGWVATPWVVAHERVRETAASSGLAWRPIGARCFPLGRNGERADHSRVHSSHPETGLAVVFGSVKARCVGRTRFAGCFVTFYVLSVR